MTTYTLEHPEKGTITFTDKKRYWWILSVVYPLIPVFAILAYLRFENPWLLLLPLLIGYVIVPLLDAVGGTDRTNPPEEIVPQLDTDSYYQTLTMLTIPMHFIALGVAMWFVELIHLI